jgi:hypothetical protein
VIGLRVDHQLRDAPVFLLREDHRRRDDPVVEHALDLGQALLDQALEPRGDLDMAAGDV